MKKTTPNEDFENEMKSSSNLYEHHASGCLTLIYMEETWPLSLKSMCLGKIIECDMALSVVLPVL